MGNNERNMKLCLFVYVKTRVFLSAYLPLSRQRKEWAGHMIFVKLTPLCLYTRQEHPRGLWMYTRNRAQSVFAYVWVGKEHRQCGFCCKLAVRCVTDGLLHDSCLSCEFEFGSSKFDHLKHAVLHAPSEYLERGWQAFSDHQQTNNAVTHTRFPVYFV